MKKDELSPVFFAKAKLLETSDHFYTPRNNNAESTYQNQCYGEVHRQGLRPAQEDGGIFAQLPETDLSPEAIGQRLWTAIKIADEQVKGEILLDEIVVTIPGTTVCVACLTEKFIITANLADTVLFAVLYDLEGEVLGVALLTEQLHHPSDPQESNRILVQGGTIIDGSINNQLEVSRAIGDYELNSIGEIVISDAAIGIYSLDELKTVLNPRNESVGNLQFIITCDGFTEVAKDLSYLKNCLDSYNKPGNLQELTIAKNLAEHALRDGSTDNVSVAVMTAKSTISNMRYFGIFDGHGGNKTVDRVVTNFVKIFNNQLALTEKVYQKQASSTSNRKENFLRDNEFIYKISFWV